MFFSSCFRHIMAPSHLGGLWKQMFPTGGVRSSLCSPSSVQGQSTQRLYNASLPPLPPTGTEAHTIACLLSSHVSRSPVFLCILPVSWKQLCPLPIWLSLKGHFSLPGPFGSSRAFCQHSDPALILPSILITLPGTTQPLPTTLLCAFQLNPSDQSPAPCQTLQGLTPPMSHP